MNMTSTQDSKVNPKTPLTRKISTRAAFAALVGLAMLAAACTQTQAAQPGQPDARPKQVASAALATPQPDQDSRLFCYVETLTADRPSIYGYMAPRGCMPSGAFHRGERMVWRFTILDVANGKDVTSDEAAGVTLVLPYGVEEQSIFKQRGDGRTQDAPWTWEVCWDVPLDYPVGSLDYSIVVKFKDGRRGEWKPPAIVDASRGVDSRPQIIP